MFDLMALLGNLNILIILLTIISTTKTKQSAAFANATSTNANAAAAANNDANSINTVNQDLSARGNFTVIEFLKDLQHLHKYDNVLLMHNKNTTIATIFYSIAINADDATDDTSNTTATPQADAFAHGIANGILSGLREQDEAAATSSTLSFVGHFMRQVQVPLVQLNELQHFNLRRQLRDDLLAIVQIDINSEGIQRTLDEHRGLLQKLTLSLNLMTGANVLFLVNFPNEGSDFGTGGVYADMAKGVVRQLFHYCWKQKMIYVAAIMADYQTTRTIYRFNPFPTSTVETVPIAADSMEQEDIYPYRLGNMQGFNMSIIIGGTEPRIIPYKKPDGKLFIGGFVGHFVLAFAHKFNCRFHQPYPYDPAGTPSTYLVEPVRNGSVEWSAGLTFPDIPFKGFSYPYEIMNWCFMIPVEADLPGYTFFTSVFKGETYVLVIVSLVSISMLLSAALKLHGYKPHTMDIVCHDDCLRGILGQPFTEISKPPRIIRYIYLKVCVLGILLTTTYNAYFSTYMTRAPKEATLNTMDDVMNSGLKVLAWEPEYREILGRSPEFKKYASLFITERNFHKYLALRDSFNTDYGYVMPTTKWTIVNEQQKVFSTPLFRQAPSFCFYNNIPMCFPVQDNSVVTALLNRLIVETAAAGLIDHWMEYGFVELVKADKLTFSDLSRKNLFTPMKVEDLSYIGIGLGFMWALLLLIFAGELLVFYRKKICASIKKRLRKVSKIQVREENQVRVNTFEPVRYPIKYSRGQRFAR